MSDIRIKMSDMIAPRKQANAGRISVRLPPKLAVRLKREVSERHASESAVVREALEDYFSRKPKTETSYDAFVRLGVVGCAKGLPRDLSTNKKYFKGFGK